MPEFAENAPVQGSVHKNKRRRRILIFCVASLLNMGLLALLLTQLLTPAPHSGSDPLVGHPAPNFSLALLRPSGGKSVLSLSNFKGKPFVLNFWASWCEPCKEEAPLLESAWKQVQAQGKDVISSRTHPEKGEPHQQVRKPAAFILPHDGCVPGNQGNDEDQRNRALRH